MAENILVVDDEREIAELVALYLRNEDYHVHLAGSASEALACVDGTALDLAILDIMLPDMDGLALCQRIREKHRYPIIMLTAKDEDLDKITGLTLGADDYVTKPFRPLELVARVKAQLRRYRRYNSAPLPDDGLISHRDLVINDGTHECLQGGKPLALTPTEFSILRILCENKGRVVSSEQLFHQLWGEEYYHKGNNTITVHVRHLREKLGDSAENPTYIKTVWGVGYKVDA